MSRFDSLKKYQSKLSKNTKPLEEKKKEERRVELDEPKAGIGKTKRGSHNLDKAPKRLNKEKVLVPSYVNPTSNMYKAAKICSKRCGLPDGLIMNAYFRNNVVPVYVLKYLLNLPSEKMIINAATALYAGNRLKRNAEIDLLYMWCTLDEGLEPMDETGIKVVLNNERLVNWIEKKFLK